MADDTVDIVEDFDAFYRGSWQEVYRAVSVTVGNADLGAEATDEAMTRAYSRWAKVSTFRNPRGWVYRVAVNWARSRQRRNGLGQTRESGQQHGFSVDDLPDPDLFRALYGLQVEHRQVVVARYLLDMSEADTAQAFGIARGTVKSRLSRALAALRKELE